MGFELSVHVTEILPNLETMWLGSLAKEGFVCEFHPSFTIETWRGGFLPIKVLVLKNSFSSSNKYGDKHLLAGFELDVENYKKSTFKVNDFILIQVSHLFFFRTAMRRSVIDLRLQCFAAATLADITGGVVVDHQANENFTSKDALKNAEREATEYENFYKDNFSELPLFSNWK